MLEKLSNIRNLCVVGEENLALVQKLNAQGKPVVFAPNHIEPQGRLATLRRNSALADDFPVLQSLLEEHDIESKIIFRGDMDMQFGTTPGERKRKQIIYHIHRSIVSLLGRLITGGIPVAINTQEPMYATMTNRSAAKEITNTLKTGTNVTIYPYGNWFKSGEQTFDQATDLQHQESAEAFVKVKDFDNWRKSLKEGFIKIAKKGQAPIVPVYIENNNGEWIVKFGKPIKVDNEIANIDIAKQYLAAMRELKIGNAVLTS